MLSGSTFTSIAFPNSGPKGTVALGINKWNTVVGFYPDSNGFNHGFKRYSNGNWIKLNYPGAQSTEPTGINDSGTIVGTFEDTNGFHGFVYRGGQWSELEDPNLGQDATSLLGISNAGVIIGYVPWGPGFTFYYKNGRFNLITDAAADDAETFASGIAANGVITGNEGINYVPNGFIAACP